MNIHVGNLAAAVSESDLRRAFGAYGQVASAAVIKDRDSGQSRAFGFVEMPDADEARAAMDGLNGTDLKGKPLRLSEAKTQGGRREDRGSLSGPAMRRPGTGRGSFGGGDQPEGRGSAHDPQEFK